MQNSCSAMMQQNCSCPWHTVVIGRLQWPDILVQNWFLFHTDRIRNAHREASDSLQQDHSKKLTCIDRERALVLTSVCTFEPGRPKIPLARVSELRIWLNYRKLLRSLRNMVLSWHVLLMNRILTSLDTRQLGISFAKLRLKIGLTKNQLANLCQIDVEMFYSGARLVSFSSHINALNGKFGKQYRRSFLNDAKASRRCLLGYSFRFSLCKSI